MEIEFMPAKIAIPDAAWDEQATLYELGFKHANEIARDLGVSPQTVSRRMKQRGAVKGSRVSESIQELVATLDRKARNAALMKLPDTQRRRLIAEANVRAVGCMVAAVLEADRQGDITLAAPLIDCVGDALGVRRRRKSRRSR